MNFSPIFIVEDNPDDVEMMLRVFRKCGAMMDVVIARDGADAVEQLDIPAPGGVNGNSIVPALVFLDIDLPKVDGFDVLRAIRQNPDTRHVPVVLLTGSASEEHLIAGHDLGANGYIQKPLDTETFKKTIARLGLLESTSVPGSR